MTTDRLSPAMEHALALLREQGTLAPDSGVRTTTIEALERRGLVDVDRALTNHVRKGRRLYAWATARLNEANGGLLGKRYFDIYEGVVEVVQISFPYARIRRINNVGEPVDTASSERPIHEVRDAVRVAHEPDPTRYPLATETDSADSKRITRLINKAKT